jgi:hypothetical protein
MVEHRLFLLLTALIAIQRVESKTQRERGKESRSEKEDLPVEYSPHVKFQKWILRFSQSSTPLNKYTYRSSEHPGLFSLIRTAKSFHLGL